MEDRGGPPPSTPRPGPRLLTGVVTSQNSIEVVTDFAIPVIIYTHVVIGRVIDWPGVVRATFQRIRNTRSRLVESRVFAADAEDDSVELPLVIGRRIVIRGGDEPQLDLGDATVLMDGPVARSLERLWTIAQGGRIDISLELPDGEERDGA